jgi:hypothetical protein
VGAHQAPSGMGTRSSTRRRVIGDALSRDFLR